MTSEALLWDAAEDPGLSEKTLTELVSARYTAAAQPTSDLKLWGMYTYAGDVIVAINPYAKKEAMAELYSEAVMDAAHSDANRGARGKPHIFGVAAKGGKGRARRPYPPPDQTDPAHSVIAHP